MKEAEQDSSGLKNAGLDPNIEPLGDGVERDQLHPPIEGEDRISQCSAQNKDKADQLKESLPKTAEQQSMSEQAEENDHNRAAFERYRVHIQNRRRRSTLL